MNHPLPPSAVGRIRSARRFPNSIRSLGSVLSVALLLVVVWQIVVWWLDLPRILLPAPWRVAAAAWQYRRELLTATAVSGAAAASGLAVSVVVGSAIATAFSQVRWIRTAFYPYVIFLQTVPIVAIAPLLITWSGYRFRTVVLVTAIICLFPIISNVTAGLTAIDRDLRDLFRIYGAGRALTLWKLRIPTAAGYLMLGMRISSGLSVIGAIVAEFFVSNGASYQGLGAWMTVWQTRAQTDALIAALLANTLLGLVMFGGVQLLGATLLRRWVHHGASGGRRSTAADSHE